VAQDEGGEEPALKAGAEELAGKVEVTKIPCSHRAPAHEKRRTKLGKSAGLVPQVLDTPINPKGGGQGHQALVEEVMEEVEAHVAEAEEAMPLRTPMMLRIPILQQRCVRPWLTSSHPQAKAQR